MAVTTAAPSLAYTNAELSWTQCGWWGRAGSAPVIQVKQDTSATYKFAAAGTSPEGHRNSFDDRMSSAVASWNGALARTGQPERLTYNNPSVPVTRILVRNFDGVIVDASKNYLGYTFVQRLQDSSVSTDFYGRCPKDGTNFQGMEYARIDTKSMPTWFTQGNEWRSYFENKTGECNDRTSNAPYSTCSKEYDYEALFLHELGHAIGQAHPEGNAELAAAACSDRTKLATMCPSTAYRWTAQRTLVGGRDDPDNQSWDSDSLVAHARATGF